MANDTIKGFQTTSGQKQYDYYSLANRPEVAELDENGKVLSSQLPSYVDDVIEATNKNSFPTTGEAGKIYVAIDTNLSYRWSGSAYVEISPSLALGENATTAHRGDHGKAAYDHSQIKEGNPHGTTKAHLGLDKVENKSSADIIGEIDYPVDSVNGKTGSVEISASDIGAATIDELSSIAADKADTIQVKTGNVITANNSAYLPMKGLKLYGKTEQFTTTGKNLFDDIGWFESHGFTKQSDGAWLGLGVNETCWTNTAKQNGKLYLTVIAKTDAKDYDPAPCYFRVFYTDGTDSTVITVKDITGLTTLTFQSDPEKTVDYIKWTYGGGGVYYVKGVSISFVDNAYEPYTGGIPAPNPDFPQELVSPGNDGSIGVTVAGKNLFNDLAWFKQHGGTEQSDGSWFNIYANEPCFTNTARVKGSMYVTAIAKTEATTAPLIMRAYYTDGTNDALIILYATNGFATLTAVTNPEKTVDYIKWSYGSGGDWYVKGVMISFVDNAYEPYRPLQTLTASTPNGLPGIPVTSGGNYTDSDGQQWICDEIDFARGVRVQRIGKCTITSADVGTAIQDGIVQVMKPNDFRHQSRAPMLCNRFENCTVDGIDSIATAIYYLADGQFVNRYWAGSTSRFHFFRNSAFTSLDAARAWFDANETTVLYILAEPIETPLSAEELTQYATLHTNKPTTTVFNNSGAEMELTYYTPTTAVQMVHSPADEGKILSIDEHGCVVLKEQEVIEVPVKSVNSKTGEVKLVASDVGALPDTTTIPDSLSDLTSDSTHRTVTDAEKTAWNAKVDKVDGKGLSTNDYTTDEKTKLSDIETGANKTIVDTALSSSSTNPVQNKVVNTAISNLNSLVGDTKVSTQISNAIDAIDYPVDSVNGKTGSVEISASDIGAATIDELSSIAADKADTIQVKTGSVISANNSAYLPMKGLKLFGKTIQNGTPTPETPVPLEFVGESGSIGVTVMGKNLLAYTEDNRHVSSGIVVSSPGKNVSAIVCTKDIDTIYISGDYALLNSRALRIGFFTEYPNVGATGVSGIYYSYETSISVKDYDYVLISFSYYGTGATAEDMKNSFMCSLEANAPYEYPTAQTLTVSTPNGLHGIGDVCDEIDFARGVRVQRIGEVVYTGNESINADTVQGTILTVITNDVRTDCIVGHVACTHFEAATVTGYINRYGGVAVRTGGVGLAFGLDIGTTASEVPSAERVPMFKAFLKEQYDAGTPVTAKYVLAQPIETPLTAEELAAYAALHSNKPTTTVFNDGGADMEIRYCTPNAAVPMNVGSGAKGKVLAVDEHGCVVPKDVTSVGAAPAGFGYRDSYDTEEAFMEVVENCLSQMSSDEVRHVSIAYYGRHSVMIHKHINGYASIEDITYAWDTDYNKRVRTMYNNEWNEWEWVNPPMATEVEYRTTERWRGYPVYTKVVNIGSLPDKAVKIVEFTSEDVAPIRCNGFQHFANYGAVTIPSDDNITKWNVYADKNRVVVITNTDGTMWNGFAQVWYVKNYVR